MTKLLILLMLCCFVSCKEKKKVHYVDWLIFGKDTIVMDSGNMDVSKVHSGIHGHNDTLHNIFITTIKRDTVYIHDTIYIGDAGIIK
jgi:hypothetical protein